MRSLRLHGGKAGIMIARYDGLAEWYDTFNAPLAAANQAELIELLGPGEGPCLDLGCGTGLYFDAIRATGRTPVGLDRSADQLRIAGDRTGGNLLQSDGVALPFADNAFETVMALWVSTDLDDFAAALKEAARVLRPGGLLVFYGVHPCFNGPHIHNPPDGTLIIHPTYRIRGWHTPSPWWREGGIRQRLGMRHLPLPDFINAFIDAGLRIERAFEPREHPIPHTFAIRARPA